MRHLSHVLDLTSDIVKASVTLCQITALSSRLLFPAAFFPKSILYKYIHIYTVFCPVINSVNHIEF